MQGYLPSSCTNIGIHGYLVGNTIFRTSVTIPPLPGVPFLNPVTRWCHSVFLTVCLTNKSFRALHCAASGAKGQRLGRNGAGRRRAWRQCSRPWLGTRGPTDPCRPEKSQARIQGGQNVIPGPRVSPRLSEA
jgi:hypothetical protein